MTDYEKKILNTLISRFRRASVRYLYQWIEIEKTIAKINGCEKSLKYLFEVSEKYPSNADITFRPVWYRELRNELSKIKLNNTTIRSTK